MTKGELVRLLKDKDYKHIDTNKHEVWSNGTVTVRLHKSGKLKPGDMHRILKQIK